MTNFDLSKIVPGEPVWPTDIDDLMQRNQELELRILELEQREHDVLVVMNVNGFSACESPAAALTEACRIIHSQRHT